MAKYKINKTGTSILRDYDGETWTTCIPKSLDNTDYQQFVQDVAEQGVEIVEGPDVKHPSYSTLRSKAYPSAEEQNDMRYWDAVNGTTVWQDTIAAIKEQYPKTIVAETAIGPVPDWVVELANTPLPADD